MLKPYTTPSSIHLVNKMLQLILTQKPQGQLECLGSGYFKNTHLVVWKGYYSHQLYFKDNSKTDEDGWFTLHEDVTQ